MRRGGRVAVATGSQQGGGRGGTTTGGSLDQRSGVLKLTTNGLGRGGKDGESIFGCGEAR
jgi:hypothetical protein